MSGLVLLDEDQQRTLYTQEPRQPPPPPPARLHSGESNKYFRVGASRDPRTNYTSSSMSSDPSTRSNGTQRNRQTEYTLYQSSPRTNFTTGSSTMDEYSAAGKHSSVTHTSSHGQGQTTGTDLDDLHGDSYPILRDDPNRESSTGSTSDHEVDQYAGTSSGLKISVRWIMLGLVVGVITGIVLSELKLSSNAARWISLPGDLFLRALKCVVVPYVFCSVAVAVGDIVFVGKVSIVGWQTAKIFALFWVSTVVVGVSVALLFRPFFRFHSVKMRSAPNAIGFACQNTRFWTVEDNGTVACATTATALGNATTFSVFDRTNTFAKSSSSVASLSLSDQIMQMITPIVSANMIGSLANGDLLSIITFSMVLGSIAGRSYFTKTRKTNYLYLSLLQLRNTFFLLMEWTIWLSPIAVVSIIAGSFASKKDFLGTFGDVYPYLIAAITAGLLQVLVVYPLIVFLLTRTNPFTHMQHMIRAYMFAFACASSLATMPVTLSCVKSARMCSQSVANFVVSIGVVSSISGMGFYLPIAVIFMAESSGNGHEITILRIIGLFVLSFVACAGTPPIPASGLVVISTAYMTLFGQIPRTAFAYVAALDFVFDRITTTCNVNDDVMALKIISETTDETVVQNQLGERF